MRLLVAALGAVAGCAIWPTAVSFPVRPIEAQVLDHPAPTGARVPRLARRPGGGVVLSWAESTAEGHALKFSEGAGGTWSGPVEIARGAGWFVNWIDVPSVVPIDRDFWLAHWLVQRAGGGPMDYDISLAISRDGGRRWTGPLRPYRSQAPAQYGFVSIFAEGESAGLVWLDGRDYSPGAGHAGSFALRYARVQRDGRILPDSVIDADVCSCCQTAATVSSAGPVVAYRGHEHDEVRDNHLALFRGGSWRRGAALGTERWTIPACPTNGPAIAAQGDGIAAAWFTAADGVPRVRAAFSSDGGVTLGRVLELDGRDPVGRLGLDRLDDGTAVVAWLGEADGQAGEALLLLRTFDRDGVVGPTRQVGRVTASRDSGVVQVAADGERVVLAWALPRPRFGIRAVAIRTRDLLQR